MEAYYQQSYVYFFNNAKEAYGSQYSDKDTNDDSD